MDVKDAIARRRSVRRFLDKPVPQDAVSRLVDALIMAPSAGNLQSRRFYMIFDRDVKRRVATVCLAQMFIAAAPLVVVACADSARISRYGARGVELYSIQDAAVSVGHMMLQAVEDGLASVWVGAFDEAGLCGVLGLPQELRPVAVVPVGYPAHMPAPPGRLAQDEVIKFIR